MLGLDRGAAECPWPPRACPPVAADVALGPVGVEEETASAATTLAAEATATAT